MEKRALRRRLLRRLRGQKEAARRTKSRAIARRLRRLKSYREARILLSYAAFDGEVETRPILRQALADGKRMAVPVTLTSGKRLLAVQVSDPERDLRGKGPFGIPQPVQMSRRGVKLRDLDMILVPGVAFDRGGHRLGRGGGYFDRFLSRVPPSVWRVGLAFDFQLKKKLPVEGHDLPMCAVITEKRTVRCRR